MKQDKISKLLEKRKDKSGVLTRGEIAVFKQKTVILKKEIFIQTRELLEDCLLNQY